MFGILWGLGALRYFHSVCAINWILNGDFLYDGDNAHADDNDDDDDNNDHNKEMTAKTTTMKKITTKMTTAKWARQNEP